MQFKKNLKISKTSLFCSIHQENTCKSSLHWNLIILTDFPRFTVNEEKLRNLSIFKCSAMVRLCDLGEYFTGKDLRFPIYVYKTFP